VRRRGISFHSHSCFRIRPHLCPVTRSPSRSPLRDRTFALYAAIEGRVSFAQKSAATEKRTIYRMTKNDFNSAPDPLEEGDPLSATGMFLSSFGAPAQETSAAKEDPFATPATRRADWPASAQSAGPASSGSNSKPASGPGEFTQMFQTMESRQSPTPPPPVTQPPVSRHPDQRLAHHRRLPRLPVLLQVLAQANSRVSSFRGQRPRPSPEPPNPEFRSNRPALWWTRPIFLHRPPRHRG
jgi:hypothetical protein